MKILIWVLTGICLIFILALLCWYFWDTVLEDIGLGEGPLIIDTKQDALQLCIILAAIGAGILVAFYTYFTRLQTEAIKSQINSSLRPIITLVPISVRMIDSKKYNLSFQTENYSYLKVWYTIKNNSNILSVYDLNLSTFISSKSSILKKNYSFDGAIEDNSFLVEKESLTAGYSRNIQPFYFLQGYFRIKMDLFIAYVLQMLISKDRAKYGKLKLSGDKYKDFKTVFNKYIEYVHSFDVINSLPFWIRFDINAYNKIQGKKFNYTFKLLFYFKIYSKSTQTNRVKGKKKKLRRIDICIDIVPESSYG